jgi:hypothetical protein
MIGGLFFVTILQYLQILHATSSSEDIIHSSRELNMFSSAASKKADEVEDIEDTL